jgi:membrane fusion protein, multidrug efflux system
MAKKTLANNQELLKKNFISQNAFDTAQSNFLVAEGNEKTTRAALDLARKALDDAIVRAPIGGVIASRNAQPGERVPIDARLYQIMDLAQMEFEAAVPTSEVGAVTIGQELRIVVDGFGSRAFVGKVDRIAPAAAAGSRAIPVYVSIANDDGALKGGMFAKGALSLGGKAGAITVPLSAIREEQGQTIVYAVEAGKVARKTVTVGLRNDEEGVAEVDGIAPGLRVVRANLGELRVGAPVQVQGKAEGAPASAASAAPPAPTAPTTAKP